tara:strand:+ start:833 stop:1804 length:972 start_codon:yes stop_codon:yes gene_type:complete
MYEAEVGNDGFGEDPTVNKIENLTAELFNKESAVFVSSGIMGNFLSILSHCQRGDQIIIGNKSHINTNELGGFATLGGVFPSIVENDSRGLLNLEQVKEEISPFPGSENDVHVAQTKLIAIENTHNSCGGRALSTSDINQIKQIASKNNIPIHLDGARIFNAAIALENTVEELTKDVDSIQFCLSKGLGAPVGSLVLGEKEFTQKVRKWRKTIGGTTRQAGILAAAGIVALNNYEESINRDHDLAKYMHEKLSEIENITPEPVETNLVFFNINTDNPGEISKKLKEKGINGGAETDRWRFVPHYGLTKADIDYVAETLNGLLN